MKNEPIQITQWVDLEGCYHNSKEEASRSNNELHLLFMEYIEEELLITFSNGVCDKLCTTNNIWQMLEFTPECIKKIIKIMGEK